MHHPMPMVVGVHTSASVMPARPPRLFFSMVACRARSSRATCAASRCSSISMANLLHMMPYCMCIDLMRCALVSMRPRCFAAGSRRTGCCSAESHAMMPVHVPACQRLYEASNGVAKTRHSSEAKHQALCALLLLAPGRRHPDARLLLPGQHRAGEIAHRDPAGAVANQQEVRPATHAGTYLSKHRPSTAYRHAETV